MGTVADYAFWTFIGGIIAAVIHGFRAYWKTNPAAEVVENKISMNGSAIVSSKAIEDLSTNIGIAAVAMAKNGEFQQRQAVAMEAISKVITEREAEHKQSEYDRLRRAAAEAEELRRENEELRRRGHP